MIGNLLSTEERVLVEELRGNTRDKGAYMKLSVLILLDMGKGYDEIEAILGIGRGSITNCVQKHRSDGLPKYSDRHYEVVQFRRTLFCKEIRFGYVDFGVQSSLTRLANSLRSIPFLLKQFRYFVAD